MPAKQRDCAGCTACCGPTLVVNEPDHLKARGETCPHRTDAGCAIWQSGLPGICRTYLCNYLVEPQDLTEGERPDRAGAILQRRAGDMLLAETFPDGLHSILQNRYWRHCIRQSISAAELITVSFWNDPLDVEMVHVRWDGQRWGVALAACDAAGKPLLVDVPTAQSARTLQRPVIIGKDELPFEPEALAAFLAERPAAILTTRSAMPNGAGVLCFRITRRQIAFLGELRNVLRDAPPE